MYNVIEIQKSTNPTIHKNTLKSQGVIHLDTDLRRDHLHNALIDIINTKKMTEVELIDSFMETLYAINYSYHTIREHLYDTNHITLEETFRKPHTLLNFNLITVVLQYYGGYPTMFEKLGYQVVKVGNTNAITKKGVCPKKLLDYYLGDNIYVIIFYQDNIKVKTYNNIYIRNENDLNVFVDKHIKNKTNLHLVIDNNLAFNYPSYPKVEKSIATYHFKPIP